MNRSMELYVLEGSGITMHQVVGCVRGRASIGQRTTRDPRYTVSEGDLEEKIVT